MMAKNDQHVDSAGDAIAMQLGTIVADSPIDYVAGSTRTVIGSETMISAVSRGSALA
jgi:hypothetical protein